MSIVIIGDRGVGKTSMMVKLVDKGTRHVKVVSPDRQSFVRKYSNPETGKIAPTSKLEEETLLVNVDLPGGERQVQVRWIDTQGETWDNKDWRVKHPAAWQAICKELAQSQGVLLLLPPHRSLVQPYLLEFANDPVLLDELQTPTAWKKRLSDWLDFLRENCPKVQHILISLHKADLFCDVQAEARKWEYKPSVSRLHFDYNNYVRNTYFNAADDIIRAYNSFHPTAPLQFFITTTENQILLELPWVYLGTYIAHT